jgi:hypothetical protein
MSAWPIWRTPVTIGSVWSWKANPCRSESPAHEKNGTKVPMSREIEVTAVTGWRKTAAQLGISKKETDRMASAFEHEASGAARAFAK